MPNPIELILDPLSLCFIGMFLGAIALEAMFSKRVLPNVSFWKTRGSVSALVYFYLASYLPLLTDEFLSSFRVLNLNELNMITQVALGLLVFELVLYGWHRLLHESKLLWKMFHQMHHSAERLDAYGALWFSPIDVLGFTFTGSIALVLFVGLDAQAATAIMFVTFALALFQHMNIKTPTWLGYLVQRPESHSVHHGRGMHRNNYSDLPVLDILFGTFSNPEEPVNTGFYHGASRRVVEMLMFKDVSNPIENRSSGESNPSGYKSAT
jgi:sterol desaturase/sphingolipid hydroxylase (fatty acid hydroxylase superfamily)